jgi:alpha-mannosidase
VGEPEFGVAIVNDSTYGYDVTRQPRQGGGSTAVARLSIIRAALFPDPQQDQGLHHLRVGLVVGATIQDAVVAGYRMNLDPRVIVDAAVDEVAPIIRVSNPGVVVEAVKLAEDHSGDVIVRLYEALGQRTTATLVADFDVQKVIATDLLEREIEQDDSVASADGEVLLTLRPFQLVTIRLVRGR